MPSVYNEATLQVQVPCVEVAMSATTIALSAERKTVLGFNVVQTFLGEYKNEWIF
jgi:hypothetical protein